MPATPDDAADGGASRATATRGAGLFGFGVGGLVDGIVLHQILQWHHLVSDDVSDDTLGGLRTNTLADGIFHATVLVIVVLGAVRMAGSPPATARRRRLVVGRGLIGFGAFHLVDAVVFHALLDLHHIRMVPNPLPYDLAGVLVGVVAGVVGLVAVRGANGGGGPPGPGAEDVLRTG